MELLDLDGLIDDLAPEDEFVDVVSGDALETKRKVKEDNGVRVYEKLLVSDILPKEGLHLGLDISKSSTGVTVIRRGIIKSWNLTLQGSTDTQFSEILLRRELRDLLIDAFENFTFDTIVLEDVYEGVNPDITRLLYSLNTVVDELILDGYIYCKNFVRVNNKSWKSWLWSIEPQLGKGLNEKARIEESLKNLGIRDSGKGYQDRLDSLGMLVGYFFKNLSSSLDDFKVARVPWSRVGYVVVSDIHELAELPLEYRSFPLVKVDTGRKELTKEYLKYLLGLHRGSVLAIKSDKPMDLVYKLLGIPYGVVGTLVVWDKNLRSSNE